MKICEGSSEDNNGVSGSFNRGISDSIQNSNENQMKACYYSNSSNKIIDFGNYPIPVVTSDDQILVKVHYASLNPVDYKFQFSKIPFYRWVIFPNLGIGKEFSGEVVYVGSKVKFYHKGDYVYGFSTTGSFQEYCLTKEKYILNKPDNISFEQACTLPLACGTVYQALRWFFANNNNTEYNYNEVDLTGKIVLVIGCSWGTGHFAIQVARNLGAQEVYGVCSQKNLEAVKSLGVNARLLESYEDAKLMIP